MPISISDLFRVPRLWWIDLTPDGKVMLYSSNAPGLFHLYVCPTRLGSKPKQITNGNNPVLYGVLSPTGDQVVYMQDEDGNEMHHLFLTSRDGTKTRKLTREPCRTSDAGWHPNGKEVARAYGGKTLCGVDIFDLRTDECFVLKEQEEYLGGIKYSHDGKWIAYTEYGGGKDPRNMQVAVVNRNDSTDIVHYKFKDGSKEEVASWSPDDRKLALLSNVRGKMEVVIQDFQNEERLFLSLEEGEEVPEFVDVGWSSKSNKVYYVVSKHSRTKVYAHPLDGERTPLPFPEGTIDYQKFSQDGRFMIALHSSMSSPPCVYSCDIESHTVTPLSSGKSKIDFSKLAKPESVWYESSDGLKIHSWYLPAGYGKPSRPAVVWPHGGPWWQVYDAWSPFLHSFSQSGFAVLAPNFRGSTGYGAEFRDMDLSDAGGGDLEDVVAGAKWLAKQRNINKSRIAICGGSYGGYMTLMALTKKPEVFAAGVAWVPVTDWSEMYELSDATYRQFMEELFKGSLEKNREAYRNSSPITFISQIRAPVLVMCGRNDSRCPIQPIEKFVKKLEEMNHSHEFIVDEKKGHLVGKVDSSISEVTTWVDYFKKTLGTG